MNCIKMTKLWLIFLVYLAIGFSASSQASSINKIIKDNKAYSSLPLIKANKVRLYTRIKVGKTAPNALVIVDTGSPWLLLEERFISEYTSTNKTIKTGYGYNKEIKKVVGKLVYADVLLSSVPKLVAKKVPIIIVFVN